jgi:hypothetical protein
MPHLTAGLLAALLTLACAAGPASKPKETAAMASAAAPAPCYKTAELSPGQVRVDCTNGESFVVRRGEDGKWREEAKSRAGSRPEFTSLDEAAKSRCGCAG